MRDRKFDLMLAMLVAMTAGSLLLAESFEAPTFVEGQYPEPRILRTLVEPSKAPLLEAARPAVRNSYGMGPLGKVGEGDTAHVFLPYVQDMDVWAVVKQAWAERGVKAIGVPVWEVFDVSKAEYYDWVKDSMIYGSEDWKELGLFDEAYMPYFPEDVQKEFGPPPVILWARRPENVDPSMPDAGAALRTYMDKHPEIEHVVIYPAGWRWPWDAIVPKHSDKFLGNWLYEATSDLVNKSGEYPSDVWNLVEEHMLKPIEYVSGGTLTDPQGTAFRWENNPQQARKLQEYAQLATNHLQIYPNGWQTTKLEGVVRATANHIGFYPEMSVHLRDNGRVVRVEGGGRTGELLQMLLDHPKLKNAHFPSQEQPGYWYLMADGFGTNPKKARNMYTLISGSLFLPNLPERERAGVQHLSFTSPTGPDLAGYSNKLIAEGKLEEALKNNTPFSFFRVDPRDHKYALDNELPIGHTAHMHVYFPTVKYQLRDTGEWITVAEKGRINAFDNPEVRALAARYGDPDDIFSYDWIPGIPGINVPGDYERDYAPDPWAYVKSEWDKISSGDYDYYVEDYDLIK